MNFLRSDSTTQGSWLGKYGQDGVSIAGVKPNLPSYATVDISGGQARVWADATNDSRALANATGNGRTSTNWSGFSQTVDVNITDGASHKVALYALDWGRSGRVEKVEAIDPVSRTVLDTRMLSGFEGGQYLVYNVAGHVQFQLTAVTGSAAYFSGVFFDAAESTPVSPPPVSPPPVSPPPVSPPAGGSNTTPYMTGFGNLSVAQNGVLGPLPFEIGDLETASYRLVLSATSSNPALLPVSGISFGGSNSSRTVTLSPLAGQSGVATITLAVTDGGGLTFTRTFNLTVSRAPTITGIGNQSVVDGSAVGPLSFTLSDDDPSGSSLTVTATSSNLTLLPVSGIALGGSGTNRTVSLNPVAGQLGATTLTLTVTDSSGLASSTSFTLTVNNRAPAISAIGSQSIGKGESTGPLSFTVSDLEPGDMAVTATSSNSTLLPATGIVLGGSGTNRTITLNPAAPQVGTATVTITATDAGGLKSTMSFTLTVSVITNRAPTISSIGNQSVVDGQSVGPLAFTVSDVESAASSLLVAASSSNTTILPVSGIVLGGSDGNRSILLNPVSGKLGLTTITLSVADAGGAVSTTSFILTVTNAAPTISSVADRVVAPGSPVSNVQFTLSDLETAPGSLNVSIASSNTSVFPSSGISLGGSGANRTVSLIPNGTQTGTSTISITVTDAGGLTAVRTFSASVVGGSSDGILITPDWIKTPYDRIPNFGGHPTLVASASGNWSSTATWGGRLPAAGEIVSIPSGISVSYDQVSDLEFDTVAIQAGGALRFRTDVNTRLRVTNLLVMPDGTLTIGTIVGPVAPNVRAQVIINDLPIDTSKDPEQYGHGLIGLGKVTMLGSEIASTWATLASEPKAGDTQIVLASPVKDWQVGSRLILPDTRQLFSQTRPDSGVYVSQDERPTVASISADGLTVTLTQPLAYSHLGARDGDGALTFLPNVGNLTRNVVVNSESATGTRGYTLFTMRADVSIENVQFSGLGRSQISQWDSTTFDSLGNVNHVGTNQKGRYAVTFDNLMGPVAPQANGYQFTFADNSVFCPIMPMPFRWGIDLNASSFGLVQGNVLFNWAGAGIMADTGAETSNVIADNFISTITSDGTNRADDRGWGDLGHEGVGVWMRGPDNVVRGNVVSNSVFGYEYYDTGVSQARVPAFQGADVAAGQFLIVNMMDTPLREFSDNSAYGGIMRIGLTIWSLGTEVNSPYADARESVVKNFHAWNLYEKGYYGYESNRLTIDGFVFRGDFSILARYGEGALAIGSMDYFQKDFLINNSNIQGASGGWMPSSRSAGTQAIKNSYMRNYSNVVLEHMWRSSSNSDTIDPRVTIIENVVFVRALANDLWWLGSQANINMIDKPTSETQNFVQSDTVFVYSYNGLRSDDFQVYYAGQAANAIVPASVLNGDGSKKVTGAPATGLTNAQTWALYRIAVGGAVAPDDAVTKAGITGLVRDI